MKNEEKNNNNVAVMNNQYTKNQLKEIQQKQKRIIYKRRRMRVVGIFVLVVLLVSSFNFFRDVQALKQIKAEKVAALAANKTANADKKALAITVAQLNDEDYVAKLARSSQYMLSKPGEQIFIFPLKSGENKISDTTSGETVTTDTSATTTTKK